MPLIETSLFEYLFLLHQHLHGGRLHQLKCAAQCKKYTSLHELNLLFYRAFDLLTSSIEELTFVGHCNNGQHC